ncbi:U1 small nuclear ribonucleoprotein C [Nakaseomyces bracarensis]|uniref:U1 small nuclear ribonucleoprotein C n=1 Tax=Nakaseomyces bracarensis TaxID=273131 RepID=A0ABR4NPN2_9SACH
MARYYCEYCHSYLTHDTLSVRKFHLMGKNHLRIRADYYRSKEAEAQQRRDQPKRHRHRHRHIRSPDESTHKKHDEKLGVRLLSRKEKRAQRKLGRVYRSELSRDIDTLSQVYKGSPGYNRVFVEANRLDVGEAVKASKLPQRANTTQQREYKDRYEMYQYYNNNTTLARPQLLTAWKTNYTTTYVQK